MSAYRTSPPAGETAAAARVRAVPHRSPTAAGAGGRVSRGSSAASALALQRLVGNAAVAGLLRRRGPEPAGLGRLDRPPEPAPPPRQRAAALEPLTVSRCGPDNPGCGCTDEQRAALESPALQRDGPPAAFPALPPGSPFGPPADRLRFTERRFVDGSLPTVCPRCHREQPTTPMPARYVDQDATEPRLVAWATESEPVLNQQGSVRVLQLDPNAADALVEDYGAGLTRRITSSNEFDGSTAARDKGAETVRRRWPDIQPAVRQSLVQWYQNELLTAVGLTPRYADPLLQPERLQKVLNTKYNERAPLGRWGAEAAPGQKYGIFEIDDIGAGEIWFHRPGRPLWLYQISQFNFIRHDPFTTAVAEQVYDQTSWVLQVTPLLLQAGAFGLGFSGSIALVIAGIALGELAEEMKASGEGRPGRSPLEILESAGIQLLVDRIFHGLLGGAGGKAATAAGKNAAKIERIADKAVPAIRRELASAEKPLVKEALDAGTARKVTDQALRAEGYAVEVAVESAGEWHIFRLNDKGVWCRFSTPICGLDLGADVAAAAKSPTSFTAAKLADARGLLKNVQDELRFLSRTYDRMRAAGRMDLSLLSAEERAMLDQLAPTGKASDLSLGQLRDLPAKLGLGRDLAAAAGEEARLVKQLYREGRPLHEIMRLASPSFASRSRVLAEAGGRDAASGLLPRTGALHVDHVVPLNDIVRVPGFEKLRPERQLEIVNDVRNLRAVDAAANTSRGDRSWYAWAQAAIHYDATAISRMRALEDELRGYLTQRIAALGRP